jgi:hypothetical protein
MGARRPTGNRSTTEAESGSKGSTVCIPDPERTLPKGRGSSRPRHGEYDNDFVALLEAEPVAGEAGDAGASPGRHRGGDALASFAASKAASTILEVARRSRGSVVQ